MVDVKNRSKDIAIMGKGIRHDKELIDELCQVVSRVSDKRAIVNANSNNKATFTNISEAQKDDVRIALELFILRNPDKQISLKNSPLANEFGGACDPTEEVVEIAVPRHYELVPLN